ncbi:MAG: hypothetical protein QM572_06955 [Nocardioides sp.]|uniref:hypothetical protein n=1 Tax=Nocardioides sp. TaxID=35761 RepID=UPI0039E24C88
MRAPAGVAAGALVLAVLLAPTAAQAAPTDAVTGLSASAVQTLNAHDGFDVAATWTRNADPAVTGYVAMLDDGVDDGTYVDVVELPATASSLTFAYEDLGAGTTYQVVVTTLVGDEEGDPASTSFTTPALDTTVSGSFSLDATSHYLRTRYDKTVGDFVVDAAFTLLKGSADADATIQVDSGDGTGVEDWTSGSTFALVYDTPGTYTPHVYLTDRYDNSRDVQLPSVTVIEDLTDPAVSITTPAKPARKASWRTVRGTASDSGVGLSTVMVYVAQRRGSTWWAYDFAKHRWLKGYSSQKKTLTRTSASPTFLTPSAGGGWSTPAIKGLKAGRLQVKAAAIDNEGNFRTTQVTRSVR